MMIFDTHAHYDDKAFDEDREKLLSGLPDTGVEAVVNVGANMETSRNTLELAKQYPWVYGAMGVHPNEAAQLSEEDIDWLKEQSAHEKILAIGEIGLDYYWEEPDPEVQKQWFARQIALAKQVRLPLIIHSRDAAKDTLDMMKGEHAEETGGVVHCFSYGKEMAREYLNMGYYLGIGGVLTFKNAKKLKEVVDYMPMEWLVLETDCPYLAPTPNRGKRNVSAYLTYVAQEIASIKGISEEKVVEITTQNAKKLYRL